MKFKYNGRIYNPSNVEKKLKKLGITLDDIEIIPEEDKNITINEDIDDDKIQVIVRSTEDDIRRVCYVPKNKSLPTIYELFKNQLWNGSTGIKGLTYEFLKTMYYDI